MKPPFNHVPAFPVVIGWIAGILFWWLGAGWWCPALMAIIGIAAIYIKLQYIAMGFYACVASWTVAFLNTPAEPPAGVFDGEERVYHAEIIRVKNSPVTQTLLLRIDSVGDKKVSPFIVKSASLPEWIPPRIGSTVKLTTILEPLDHGRDFAFQTDYSLDNLRQSIVAQTYIEGDSLKVTGRNTGLRTWLDDRRETIVSLLAHSHLDDTSYGLLSALITGYGDELAPEMRENFRATGIAHALALSGFHVGIIILFCSFIMFPLNAWPRLRPLRYAISLGVIWLYAGMVGLSESVVRASVMFSVLVLCRIAGRRPNGFNALCMAVLVMLAIWPNSLFSPGFQLSVCAVLGILVFNKPLNPFSPKSHKAYMAMQYITLPVSALIGTIPLTIYYFHKLPMLFLASNLIVTLLLPALMVCGIGIILLSACGLGSGWLCAIANWMVKLISDSTESLSTLTFAQTAVYMNAAQCLLLAVALIIMGIYLYNKSKLMTKILPGAIILCASLIPVCQTQFPEEEAFIVRSSGNTSIILREGNKAAARMTSHPGRVEAAKMRLERELEPYMGASGTDTLIVTIGDAKTSHYKIQDNILYTPNGKIAILHRNYPLTDTLTMKADKALICSRFRGSVSDVIRLTAADTVLLSRDLSLKHAKKLSTESPVPVVDLRYKSYKL